MSPAPLARLPTVSLAGLRWQDYDGLRLPLFGADGPRNTDAGLARGFAQTPRGCLAATIHIVSRAESLVGSAVFRPTIDHQVIGANRAALRATMDNGYAQGRESAAVAIPDGAPLNRSYATLRGFRFEGYTPSSATVHVVFSAPDTSGATVMTDFRVEAAWDGGDWKIIAPPDGDWATVATHIKSLAGNKTFPAAR